jgi:hypothetical protein
MRKPVRLYALVCGIILRTPTAAFQFVISNPNEPECFVIEEPQDTAFVVKYKFPGAGFGTGSGAVVTLTDTSGTGKELFKARVEEQQGTLTMTTGSNAKHDLCVRPEGSVSKPVVFSVSVTIGHSDGYYEEMAGKEHLDRLQLEVVRLTDQLAQILDEADYMKEREVDFHAATEQMDRAAKWWPILQICILLLTSVFQARHLKRFFQQQKMLV